MQTVFSVLPGILAHLVWTHCRTHPTVLSFMFEKLSAFSPEYSKRTANTDSKTSQGVEVLAAKPDLSLSLSLSHIPNTYTTTKK